MEEIEKLRIRVEKDPNSRLFLPLAEEFRKSGLLDEAITVILRGLEYQPAYTSARVALGRLYLEKNMIGEARDEFENVVKAIPDNLFSHKKLAEIYKAGGDTEMAVREYKKVIELNPLDDDARMSLEAIEGKPEEAVAVIPAVVDIKTEPVVAEESASPLVIDEEVPEETELAATEPDDDFEKFKASFSPAAEEAEEAAPVKEELFSEQTGEGGIEDLLGSEDEEAEVIELPEDAGFEDAFSIDSSFAAEPEALPEGDAFADKSSSADGGDMAAADSFVASGNYYKAMEIYRKLLTGDPDNKQLLQRVIELKSLLKLLGKGEEVLVARLDAFLGAIKRNFDKGR